MRSDWPVVVHRSKANFTVEISEVVVPYDAEALREWERCREAWRDGYGPAAAAWRDHKELFEFFASGRYHFAHPREGQPPYFRNGDGPYGWDECLAALQLQRKGFTCWTGMWLFGPSSKPPQRRANTEAIEALLHESGCELPRTAQQYVNDAHTGKPLLPKTPDVAAYHGERNEWRFCEVKRRQKTGRDEPVHRHQIIGLALLHLLTGGPVAVIRFLPRGCDYQPRTYPAEFYYDGPNRRSAMAPTTTAGGTAI